MMALGVDIAIIIPSKQRWSGVKKGKSCNYQRHYPGGRLDKKVIQPDTPWRGHTCLRHSNLIQNAKLRCPVSFYLWGCGWGWQRHLSGALSVVTPGDMGAMELCWCGAELWWPPQVIRRQEEMAWLLGPGFLYQHRPHRRPAEVTSTFPHSPLSTYIINSTVNTNIQFHDIFIDIKIQI